jgi:hypothetical protein
MPRARKRKGFTMYQRPELFTLAEITAECDRLTREERRWDGPARAVEQLFTVPRAYLYLAQAEGRYSDYRRPS